MKTEVGLNFDAKTEAEIVKLFDEIRKISDEAEAPIIRKGRRWDALFHNKLDLTGRDPHRIYPMIGFAFSTMQTYLAATVKTLFPSSPQFPIKARREDLGWNRTVEVHQEAMDWHSTQFSHMIPLMQTLLHSHLWGNGWACAQWKVKPKLRTYKQPRRAGGRTVGYNTVTDWVLDEGLKIRNVPPWMVRFDPIAESLRETRWIYTMEVVSRTRLKQHMGQFADRYGKKYDELKDRKLSDYGDTGKLFMDMVNYSRMYEDKDLCMFVRLYLPFQYRCIELVDGENVVRDYTAENPEDFEVPIKPFINTLESVPTTLRGMSDMNVLEQLGNLLQDTLGARINSLYQQLDQVWLYDRDIIPDPRMMMGGNSRRIGYSGEVMRQAGKRPEDIITQLQSYATPSDSFRLSEEIERQMQNATGTNKVAEGGISEDDDRTMFEIKTAIERHDVRRALSMKTLEITGIELLAADGYNLQGKYLSEEGKRMILGDKAQYWAWDTPFDVPGGIMFRLKGSALMAGLAAKQEELNEMWDRFHGSGLWNEKKFVDLYIDNSEAVSRAQKDELKTVEQPPMGGPAGAGGGAGPAGPAAQVGPALPPGVMAA